MSSSARVTKSPLMGGCSRRSVSWSRAGRAVALITLAVLCTAEQSAAQVQEAAITGRVLSLDDRSPVSQADVHLAGTELRAITGPNGLFRLDRVRPGSHVLRVERLGYAPRVDSIVVAAGTVVDLEVLLSVDPVQLEPLVAVIRSLVLERAGFYTREAQGFGGTFLDPGEIRDRRPSQTTDLFRSLPGINVAYGGLYGSQVLVNQRVTFSDNPAGCVPTLWLDGIRSTMRSYDMMRVDEIEGVEVYAGGGPGKFNDVCGSVLIWTRVPIR